MKRILLSLAAALCMCASAAAQTVAPFKDGDRAVFLGNSITDGGHYHSYIWLYYMTRFPYMDLRVMNAGIGGETAGDMYKRLDGDVLSKRPTVLTVTFGMNDTGYMEYNGDDAGAFGEKKYRECYDNFKKMEKRLQTLDGVRVVMLGGSPYDETAQIENNAPLRGKNAVMDRVVGFQKESAAANGWDAYKKAQTEKRRLTTKGILISVAAGIIMAFFYRFVAASMDLNDFAAPAAGKMTPYTAVFIFAVGVFVSNFLFNTVAMKRPVDGEPVRIADYFKGGLKTHMVGVLGGMIWCLGESFSMIASGKAGAAISYGLGQGATLVSALWGILIWKEFKGAPKISHRLNLGMFLLFLTGLGMLIYAGA